MSFNNSKYEHVRTGQRRAALSMLYASQINPRGVKECLQDCRDLDLTWEEIKFLRTDYSDYALDLARGVEAFASEIDKYLEQYSENWKLDRMSIIDLLILRLALYEILYFDKVPVSVSIDEAVEIAKDFGREDDSHKFINGLLGKIVRKEEIG